MQGWTKLSSKGQVVIPKEVRQELHLTPNTRLRVTVVDGGIRLEPIKQSAIDSLYGMFRGCDLIADLEEDHRKEIEADEAAFRS